MYLTVGPNILVGQQETPVSHYPIYICMLQSHITKIFLKNGKRRLFEQFKDTCTECPKILCCPRNYTGKKLHNSKEFIHTKPMMLRKTSNILSDTKLNNQIPNFQIENFKYPLSESRYWNFLSLLLITAKHQWISLWIGTNIWDQTM